jgi:thimet oligopeptidase
MLRKRYTKADFAWTKWGPKEFKKVEDRIIKDKKAAYAAVRAIPAKERTFENTLLALEREGYEAGDQVGYIGILKETSPDPKVRLAAATTIQNLSQKLIEIEFDPRMYAALKEYAARKEKLSGADKLLFEDAMKGYARMGFDLPKKKQNILKNNLKKLAKLAMAFDRNLNEYKDHILVTKEELDGLPAPYVANLAREGQRYKVTLSYPDAHPFIAGAHNAEKRRELLEKFFRKGGVGNVAILKQMFKLRALNAKLLGYKSFVDYVTEERMAKSARSVERFLADLERRTRAQVGKDRAMLTAEKRRRTKDAGAKLEAHDIAYLFKQVRLKRYALDSDLLKEYFPFEHVKRATLAAYEQLLSVRFKERKDLSLWHKDVQAYEVYDKSGEFLSMFLLDLYPREGKYGHAAAFDIVYGREVEGSYRAPLCTMVTNFPKPSKANPSLMSHGEVETFFHEFGHVMHFCLTRAEYRSQAGFAVAWDFVEAPSQMLENWCWDKGMLRKLSKHYKKGKSLPDSLINKLLAGRLFGEAWSVRAQLLQATLDYILHTKGHKNPVKLYEELQKKMMDLTPPKGQLWIAGFGHLAHGYEGAYYSYLWSKVYADDMFTRFEKAGVLNSRVGKEYRTWILEKGSSMEEMDLVKGFLGRAPNNKAFLKSIGV